MFESFRHREQDLFTALEILSSRALALNPRGLVHSRCTVNVWD